ncbi:glycosyl transferase, group 2 family protein [alpha proteobacterium U9-1i]|nr:glycosyl transferase, group 2 family protein [alpha proteobacterium U9-1i]
MSSVDIVVPCYNYAHYLDECIATLTSQRDVDVRVLIVDDCSPDNTAEIGQRIAAADIRVTYERNEKNLGLIGTANRGIIDWAEADYTLLISADDALAPGALARAAAMMDADTSIGMTYGIARIFGQHDKPEGVADTRDYKTHTLTGAAFLKYNCEIGNPAPSPCAITRTSLQKKVGGYSPALKHTSDMEMWMRFALNASVGVIGATQGYYRWHGQNMTALHTSSAVSDLRHRLKTCAAVHDERGGKDFPGFTPWYDEMRAKFARDALWLAGEAYARGHMDTHAECVAFARECDPSIAYEGPTWRHRVKRMIGPTLLKALNPSSQAYAHGGHSAAGEWFKENRDFGWWPGEDTERKAS